VQIGDQQTPDFSAVVAVREPLGDETIYDLQVGEQMIQTRQSPSLRLPLGSRCRCGSIATGCGCMTNRLSAQSYDCRLQIAD